MHFLSEVPPAEEAEVDLVAVEALTRVAEVAGGAVAGPEGVVEAAVAVVA